RTARILVFWQMVGNRPRLFHQIARSLLRAFIFLILGVALVTVQSISEEERIAGISRSILNQFFGLSVAQFLAEFVTCLPILGVFGFESGFNPARELA